MQQAPLFTLGNLPIALVLFIIPVRNEPGVPPATDRRRSIRGFYLPDINTRVCGRRACGRLGSKVVFFRVVSAFFSPFVTHGLPFIQNEKK